MCHASGGYFRFRRRNPKPSQITLVIFKKTESSQMLKGKNSMVRQGEKMSFIREVFSLKTVVLFLAGCLTVPAAAQQEVSPGHFETRTPKAALQTFAAGALRDEHQQYAERRQTSRARCKNEEKDTRGLGSED
jgi:hypothetical protein